MEQQKTRASQWFATLQERILDAFETLEDEQVWGKHADLPAGRFERKKTQRDHGKGGGGLMAVMRGGRLFEKVGVNISTVHGTLSLQAQNAMAERKDITFDKDPRFWASGISLVAHLNSPLCPAVHMNTRMFWTPNAWWFGGGTDLNPMIEDPKDTAFFHNVLQQACDRHDPKYYPKFKDWADTYFMIKHWNEPRGVGGIFYDDLNSNDWEADFAFTQEVGNAFLEAYVPILQRNRQSSWTQEQREIQLVKRGRYAEFNLVYDRGTHFGLQSGHDPSAVLMSLPPVAKWP